MVFSQAAMGCYIRGGLPPFEEPEESAAFGEEPLSWAAAPEKLNLLAFSPVYSTIFDGGELS